MPTNEWFRLPATSSVDAFAQAQIQLYRHDPGLQNYFLPLQLNFSRHPASSVRPQSLIRRLHAASCQTSYEIFRRLGRRKYRADVLFCPMPYFQRPLENQFLMRMFIGLAETDATVLCLLPNDALCRIEMMTWLQAQGRTRQVTFLDPVAGANPLAAKILSRAGRIRGTAVFNEIGEILRPVGQAPTPDSAPSFVSTATHVEAWRYLEPDVEFGAVVTRCHWQTLCSAVSRTAQQRGKPVITFQQGVIGHTLDVPVTASKYIAFGHASTRFLARMNRSFFQAVEAPEPAVEFISGGSLFDCIIRLPAQFSKHTLLIIDEPVGTDDFFGIGRQREAILQLAEQVLRSLPSARILIRPHPYWTSLGLDAWKALAQTHPDRCELSHAAWTLEEDLNRSSVVLGIFSGALTIAAAAGLPTFFMAASDGFATEDLACFNKGQTCRTEDALLRISRVLTSATAYAAASATALENARNYYADGANLQFNPPFFDRLFQPVVSTATPDSQCDLFSSAP